MTEWNSTVISNAGPRSKELEELARRELGETAEMKQRALNELRELISGEPLLDCPMDEAFLVKFLRARKYDMERTFDTVKKYFKYRRDMPEIFGGLTPDSIPFDTVCAKHRVFTASCKKDPQGRIVIMLNCGAWAADVCSINDLFRVGAVILEHLLLDEEAQIKGVVVVFNMKGLSLHHIAHYTPSVTRKLVQLGQECCVMRIKAIYMINNPAAFDVLFSIAKIFMKAKMIQRTQLLGYDVEKMRKLLPHDLIPEKDGGTFESYDYEAMKRDMQRNLPFFQEIQRFGYRNEQTNRQSASSTESSLNSHS